MGEAPISRGRAVGDTASSTSALPILVGSSTHTSQSLGIPQALSSNLSQQLEPTHPRREGLAEMPAYLGSSVGPSEASPAKEL